MLFRCFWGDLYVVLLAVELSCILAYLAKNSVSADMVANHVFVLKAMFTLHSLQYGLLDNPNVSIRSMGLTRPLNVVQRNIMSLEVLKNLISHCDSIYSGQVFKIIFLIVFLGFLRISNLAQHSGGGGGGGG